MKTGTDVPFSLSAKAGGDSTSYEFKLKPCTFVGIRVDLTEDLSQASERPHCMHLFSPG